MMQDVCLNCGRDIRVMIFRGTGWCSNNCRKVLLGKAQCTYEEMWTEEMGYIPICMVHGYNSKYPERMGDHRPCLEVDPW